MDVKISNKIMEYICSKVMHEDGMYQELVKVHQQVSASLDQYRSTIMLSPYEAKLIGALLKISNCKTLLEIGGLAGFSAISFALQVPDLVVSTIERDQHNFELIKKHVAVFNLESRVKPILGDAVECIHAINNTYDAVFIDANKKAYPYYLEQCGKLLNKGGLVIADNALQLDNDGKANPYKFAIDEFNNKLFAEFNGVILPTQAGLSIGVAK